MSFSRDDDSGDEVKRSQRESKATERKQAAAAGTNANDNKDVASGTHTSAKAITDPNVTVSAGQRAQADQGKDETVKPLPVVSHQMATRSVTGRLTKRLRSFSPPHSPPPSKKQGQ